MSGGKLWDPKDSTVSWACRTANTSWSFKLEKRNFFGFIIACRRCVRPTSERTSIFQWKEAFDSLPGSDDLLFYARTKSSQKSLNKARRQTQQGKLKEAEEVLERLVQSDPNDFEAWTELGTAHFQGQKLDKAQISYQKALELRSDFTPALVNLAKVHFARKAFEPAAEFFRQALATEPDLAESHFLLAETYLQLKKGSLAVEHFQEALEIDPDGMADAHLRMATLYHAAGWPEEAAKQYRDFLEKKPDYQGRKELESYITEHLKDTSCTRARLPWDLQGRRTLRGPI